MTRLHTARLLTAAATFCVFLPALIVPYAFSDDYMLLSIADGQGPNPYFGNHIVDFATANGRPFQGILVGPVFAAAGSIDNLRFVRLIGVVGIVALALLLQTTLVRSRIRPGLAGVIAVLVCTLPAFQVYASWAVLFSSPYAAIFAGLASLIVVGAIDLPWKFAIDRYVCATALLVVSLLTYQPAAMFFWLFLAVTLIGAAHDSRRTVRLIRVHLLLGGAALGLGFLAVKLGAWYVGPTSDTFRNALTTDVAGKARWFFNQPLYHSLNFSNLAYSRWLPGVAVVLMVVGIPLLLWKRQIKRPWIHIGTAIGLVPLAYLPNLVVREDWATFRTQVALSSLLALYTVLGSIGIWVTVRDWLTGPLAASALENVERAVLAIGLGAVAISAFLATKNVTTLFALPSNTELRALRTQVAALPSGQPRVGFVLTPSNEGLASFHVYDEFGVASTSLARVAQAAVWLVLQEEGRLTPGQHPAVDVLRYPTAPVNGEPLVNVFPTIQTLR